jgi:alpha-L-rhamnosidase
MKLEKILISFLPVLFGYALPGYTSGPSARVPYGLTVEYIREPENTRICDSQPEFGWIVQDGAVIQKAYQIMVSTDNGKIRSNNGDIWNSGQVKSSKSVNISFGGGKLKENTTYFWKIRIWDQNNNPSEYSEVQVFRTGKFGKKVSSGNIFQVEKIPPVNTSKTSDESYLFDFGKDAFGTLELSCKTSKSDTLIVCLGEKLLNGKIDPSPGGTIRYAEIKLPVSSSRQNYTLRLKRDKRNTGDAAVHLPDSLGVVMPFRYVEIKKPDPKMIIGDVRQKALFYYFDESQSDFSSSDTVLNRVWEMCRYSMKGTSFCGLYIDGDRERIPYEADAYINQLGHYCIDREYSMAKQTIEWFMQHPTWPTEWLLTTAMLMYQDYYYSGDTELLRTYYEELKQKTLIDLAREDGLISSQSSKVNGMFMKKLGFTDTTSRIRDIVDWPPAQKDTGWKLVTAEGERDGHEMLPINTVVNCFFYENMKIMAEIAGILKKPDDKDHFELMAAKVKQTINQKLFNTEKGIYIDGEGSSHSSLHSNMMALAFGIIPEKNIKRVVEFVKSRGMACSVYGAQFLLEGLYLAGEEQYALDLMRATNDRSWWNMIKAGSTISLEAWDMKYKPNSDWNHAWGAAPANIIPRYLWGIQPKTSGSDIVKISPQMGDLKFSSIKTPVIHGLVKGEYQLVNDHLKTYSFVIPANMTAEFSLNLSEHDVISLNGKKISRGIKSIILNPGLNLIEIKSATI